MSNLTQFKSTELRSKKLRGFTLIEVLVTVVVVSIGLLGLAGLQINGLRANVNSEAHSKATLLASDIIERMRANPQGVETGQYDGISVSLSTCDASVDSCVGSATEAAECTASEMAAFDVWEWACGSAASMAITVNGGGLTEQLPNSSATVNCDTTPCAIGSPHTITINWSVLRPSAEGTATATAAGTDLAQSIILTVVP